MLLYLLRIALPRSICEMHEPRRAHNRVHCQLIPVDVVAHAHVERCRSCAFFLVTTYVHTVVIVPTVGEPMNAPRIAVEGEDTRLVFGKCEIVFLIAQAMWMLRTGLQRHQVHHVDYANLDIRDLLA